ncbi:helix-turn-helix transcriptional regulator [Sphingopyxis sp.]|uniref:helix-turn-helix domain-containing protein n=1 Tax=Sphingopyxis sp. TaxID=1908224 RepID=UPI002D766720|nr:helix-turn-helix transcriptional regulator [Sphingopyxis sp.]HET6523179.1 helix-turn-helix transcriptional regulator [Sphingopyxis sp.]
MAKIMQCDEFDCDDRLFEERFLLHVQTRIQKLLHRKKLRYRDLSKRLGVSEARVSQMLGDDASNLTIRTVARIFYCLEETPRLTSEKELQALLSGRTISDAPEEGGDWKLEASNFDMFVMLQGQPCNDEEGPHGFRAPRNREWMAAEPALRRA